MEHLSMEHLTRLLQSVTEWTSTVIENSRFSVNLSPWMVCAANVAMCLVYIYLNNFTTRVLDSLRSLNDWEECFCVPSRGNKGVLKKSNSDTSIASSCFRSSISSKRQRRRSLTEQPIAESSRINLSELISSMDSELMRDVHERSQQNELVSLTPEQYLILEKNKNSGNVPYSDPSYMASLTALINDIVHQRQPLNVLQATMERIRDECVRTHVNNNQYVANVPVANSLLNVARKLISMRVASGVPCPPQPEPQPEPQHEPQPALLEPSETVDKQPLSSISFVRTLPEVAPASCMLEEQTRKTSNLEDKKQIGDKIRKIPVFHRAPARSRKRSGH